MPNILPFLPSRPSCPSCPLTPCVNAHCGCAPLCGPAQTGRLPSADCTGRHAIPRAGFLQSCPRRTVTPLTSVLIVDDEEPIRELLARWVQSLHLQACVAANAEEAVATLQAQHCD